MTFDTRTLTEERYEKRVGRTARDMGWGATDGALAVVNKYLNDCQRVITERLSDITGRSAESKLLRIIAKLDHYVLSLCGLQITLSSVAKCDSLSKTLYALGYALEREVYAHGLKEWNGSLATRLEDTVKRRNGALKYRRAALRKMASKEGYRPVGWTPQERLIGGTWLLGCVLETDAFTLVEGDNHRYVSITEEALAVSDTMVRQMMEKYPAYLPMLTPPPDWTDTKQDLQGYETFLVRKRDKVTQGTLRGALKSGQLGRVLDAVNAAQRVSYSVNEEVLWVIQKCYEEGLQIEGIPPLNDIPPPPKETEWDQMTPHEKKVWRKEASKIEELNRAFVGQRLMLDTDIETAKWIVSGGNKFWTPLNLDYRGRLYGIPSFNFQRQDYVRSLFLFADGKPLGADGLYWLKVHIANCGDFDKISKRPFDERVQWVNEQWHNILDIADNPLKYVSLWSQADKPFMFLAACIEYRNACHTEGGAANYVCRLPVSFDGSCSGLQHLCAMTRAEEGALVNLAPNAEPQDVYETVAQVAREKVTLHLNEPKWAELAKRAIAYGVNRSLVKRNVMTYSYSSKRFGMAQQLLEDTMKPLADKLLTGELTEHPFGTDNGYGASRYLASVTYESIEAVVSKPAEAMRYLQGIARALAHEGKPVIWTTPLGFPVVLRYPNMELKRINLFLYDRGATLRVNPTAQVETKGIDKAKAANGIAPSFVHSMDACHLQMVVNEACHHGITNIALVHDSFGCLPADASAFRTIIKTEFYKMYLTHDVLRDIRDEATKQTHENNNRLPALPEYGGLRLEQVLDADYAFA